MRLKMLAGTASAVLWPFMFVGVAHAATLGITAPPSGSSPQVCGGDIIAQQTDDASTPYRVPGTGRITAWQTVTTADTPGAPLTFVVLRSTGGANYSVVGADSEAVPNPLPAGGVASFPLSTPIAVQAGDTLALYSPTSSVVCYFQGGSTPAGDTLIALTDPTPPPAAGQAVTMTGSPSPNGYTMNLAATIVSSQDAAVATTAGPSGANAGQAAVLASTVTNGGPDTSPITFTDSVPSGLTVSSAIAGDGACSTSGQTVTCTISGLGAGQSVPVDVIVTPASPGTYTNHVSVVATGGDTDPNTANNAATASLSVGLALPARCVVPNLKNTPSGVAKTVLRDLGCTVKTSSARSKSVRKGLVISTKPGAGSYAYQQTIKVVISSGPPKHKKKKKK